MASGPLVQVNEGKLKGRVCNTSNNFKYYSFKGIPYAKPPIGDLRFSAPTPSETWESIRDATQDCNICAQYDKETNTVVGDEDCLYLNVYTPHLPGPGKTSLPVIVFIHGGGFIFGHGTDDSAHGPDFLVEKNIIFVSFNYRLGILGFLSLDVKEAPGNVGLKDQVQALKWVQQNISNFGGDSKNVTVFGISAGAASVEYLLLSPMSKGLFNKAIAQSGSSLLHWAQNNNSKKLVSKIPLLQNQVINDDKKLLHYLKSLSTDDLIISSMNVLALDKSRGGIHFGFVPAIEKTGEWEPFMNKSTYELLLKGEFMKIPLLAGFCEREGLLMLGTGRGPILEKVTNKMTMVDHLPFKIDETVKDEINNKLKSIYAERENKFTDSNAFAIDFFTDVDFLGGVYVATKLIAKYTAPVYFYEFTYDGGLNYLKRKMGIDRDGACHGDDGGYSIKAKILKDPSKTDELVRDRMVEMWTNFAKYGNPTPSKNKLLTTIWEPMTEAKLAYLKIDKELTMQYDLYPERMKLFQELYEKYYDN